MHEKDKRGEGQKMKRLGVLLWMCCVLWLAACGSQESDGFVTGKYYYP